MYQVYSAFNLNAKEVVGITGADFSYYRSICYGTTVRDSDYTLGGRRGDGRTVGRQEDGGTTGGRRDDGRTVGRRDDGGTTEGRRDDGRTAGGRRDDGRTGDDGQQHPSFAGCNTGDSGTRREREWCCWLSVQDVA